MAIQATEVNDTRNGRATALRRTLQAFSGERYFSVNTADVERAFTAPGLPAIGTPFSANLPKVLLQSIDVVQNFGTDGPMGENGTTYLRCSYTERTDGSFKILTPGTKYTEFVPNVESVTVTVGPRETPVDLDPEGVSKRVGTTQVNIYTYYANENTIPLARLIELQNLQAVNDAAITLPPLYGATRNWALGTGQACYTSYNLITENGMTKLVHSLLIAEDHKAYWWAKNANGQKVGEERSGPIYSPRSFANLW